jgi:K+-sensing histidine kinase KdpD
MTTNYTDTPTILTCVDTHNASYAVLRYACYRAKKLGFAVQVLAVTDDSHKNLLFGSRAIAKDKKEQIEKNLRKLLEKVHAETGIIPAVSIREGDVTAEIIKEIRSIPRCANLLFGKSHGSSSDNTVLPKVIQKIGDKIRIPVSIIPENLSEEYFKCLD